MSDNFTRDNQGFGVGELGNNVPQLGKTLWDAKVGSILE